MPIFSGVSALAGDSHAVGQIQWAPLRRGTGCRCGALGPVPIVGTESGAYFSHLSGARNGVFVHARDAAGCITLRRESREAVVKKAEELRAKSKDATPTQQAELEKRAGELLLRMQQLKP